MTRINLHILFAALDERSFPIFVFSPQDLRFKQGFKMIGSLLTRGLVLILGYAYPAYECYKSVELNKPDIEQLRFWCQYWIPMYGEAKLAFFVYLWFPKTKGTTYIYDSFFRPYVSKHENEIDRNLLELRTRAGDIALLYWQKGASYAQTRVYDILHYIALQSTPKRPAQPQNQGAQVQKPAAPSDRQQAQDGQPSNPASSTSAREHQKDASEVARPSEDAKKAAPAPAAALNEPKTTPKQAPVPSSKISNSNEEQKMQIDSVPPSANESAQPALQDKVIEEAGRLTRARSRRNRAT
ncbi:HVA22-like protein i [Sesamum alatum]|uniref:HVA22-like protein n=1 Tax=Sesamum alatum TaxID=300844 RepID=A0AAE2CU71_9LAMI|nr:HVA22-like protein i [Sesamum alatum]